MVAGRTRAPTTHSRPSTTAGRRASNPPLTTRGASTHGGGAPLHFPLGRVYGRSSAKRNPASESIRIAHRGSDRLGPVHRRDRRPVRSAGVLKAAGDAL